MLQAALAVMVVFGVALPLDLAMRFMDKHWHKAKSGGE